MDNIVLAVSPRKAANKLNKEYADLVSPNVHSISIYPSLSLSLSLEQLLYWY